MPEHPVNPPESAGPAVVLVAPQLGENIGTAARAMANFGLTDLRIVNPREGWPNEKAAAAASRAPVIETARVFATVEEAVADLGYLLATTARSREVAKDGARARARRRPRMRAQVAAGTPIGVLFGRERSGLTNEEVALADAILTLPVDPAFSSLNIAQAVIVVAYEWRLSGFADEAAACRSPARWRRRPPRKTWCACSSTWKGRSTGPASSARRRSAATWCWRCAPCCSGRD